MSTCEFSVFRIINHINREFVMSTLVYSRCFIFVKIIQTKIIQYVYWDAIVSFILIYPYCTNDISFVNPRLYVSFHVNHGKVGRNFPSNVKDLMSGEPCTSFSDWDYKSLVSWLRDGPVTNCPRFFLSYSLYSNLSDYRKTKVVKCLYRLN